MPYVSSIEELDRLYNLLSQNLTGNQKKYFSKLYDRRQLWSWAHNKQNSLGADCTGLVENINKLLKQHVSLKSSLVEYLYRTILFTSKLNEKDSFSKEDIDSLSSFSNHLQGSPCVIQIKDKLSEYAVKTLILSLIKSMCWSGSSTRPFEIISTKNNEHKYTLKKTQNGLLECPCTAFLSTGLPCVHVLRLLTEQKKEKDVLKYVSHRWYKQDIIPSDNIVKDLELLLETQKESLDPLAELLSEEEHKE